MTEKKKKRNPSRCKWFMEWLDITFPKDEGDEKGD